MICFWTAAIGYVLEEIQIDLNVILRDEHLSLKQKVVFLYVS